MLALFTSADVALMISGLGAAWVTLMASMIFRRAGDARDSAHEAKAQMHTNGGSSLRDAVDRIELNQFRSESKWDARFGLLENRTARMESAANTAVAAAVTANSAAVTANQVAVAAVTAATEKDSKP